MGFCRRCGDIVSGERCRCGGLPVAPVVSWNKLNPTQQPEDKWSQTYVSKERSPTRARTPGPPSNSTPSVGKLAAERESKISSSKFPRPLSSVQSSSSTLGDRVSNHIATTTSTRPPSPLKQSTILPSPESNIIPSLSSQTSSLSKVYGSVLQPKESLETHACAICSTEFPPDATIYPDPSDTSQEHRRFLCKACFVTNGGSKGACPECTRPVLLLKSEGGFVYASGRYWHKKCFNCDGCGENLGEKPLVDLMGRPSCADCFDGCLKRDPSTPKKRKEYTSVGPTDNLGGMKRTPKEDRAQSSPALEELELRLSMVKSREGSPTLEELEQRLSSIGKGRESPTRSPLLWKSTSSRPGLGSPSVGSPLPGYDGDNRNSISSKASITDSSPNVRQRFSTPERDIWRTPGQSLPLRSADSPSPVRSARNSPAPTEEAIEEMKQRFLRGTSMSPSSASIAMSPPSVVSPSPLALPRMGSIGNLRSPPQVSRIPRSVALTTQRRNDTPSIASSTEVDSVPPTPDLISDFSDVNTVSSGPDSPPQPELKDDVFGIKSRPRQPNLKYNRGDFLDDEQPRGRPRQSIDKSINNVEGAPKRTFNSKPQTTYLRSDDTVRSPPSNDTLDRSRSTPSLRSDDHCCAGCQRALFSIRSGGRYVTVPDDPTDPASNTKSYHPDCFRCYVCNEAFKESAKGQASFVKGEHGPCHIECAPPEKISVTYKPPQRANTVFPVFTVPDPSPTSRPTISTSPSYNSSRYEKPPKSAPATQVTFPRFGSSVSCPGCSKQVSPMERGVIPGPQGTRWHTTCLVCGGKKESKPSNAWILGRGEVKKRDTPGCGKKLDSAAKTDGDGKIWCRECWLMLPLEMRASPQVSPLRPTPTGNGSSKIAAQMTGTTTIARQFTGMTGGDGGLIRQMTGGGISPTRHLSRSRSPTKPLGAGSEREAGAFRPRPKSVIGMRSTKSIDEGRGMFLIRQMTGGAVEA